MRIIREIHLRARNFVMIRGIEDADSIVLSSHKGGLFGSFLRFNTRGLMTMWYLLFIVTSWFFSNLLSTQFNISASSPNIKLVRGVGFLLAIPLMVILYFASYPLQEHLERFILSRNPSQIDIFAKDSIALKRLKALKLTQARVFELSELIDVRLTKEPKRLQHYFIRFSSEGKRFNLLNMEFIGPSLVANYLIGILEKGDFSNLEDNAVETPYISSVDQYLHTVSVPEPRISTKYAAMAQGSALFACFVIPYLVYVYLNPWKLAKQLGDSSPIVVATVSLPLLELINLIFATYHYTITETDISKDSISF